MENQLKIFSNSNFGDIRTVLSENNEPLFCLLDICNSIGISNNRNVKSRLDADDVHQIDVIDSLNRNQQVTFINESALYDVIIRSDSEQAKPFKKWITHEVLPSIRKDGGYIATKEDDTPDVIMARAVLLAQKTIDSLKQQKQILEQTNEILKQENKLLEPKAKYVDEVLQSTSTFTFNQIAEELGYKSAQAFYKSCIKNNILYKQGKNYLVREHYKGKGFFANRSYQYFDKEGRVCTNIYLVITEIGRAMLHHKLVTKKEGTKSCQ